MSINQLELQSVVTLTPLFTFPGAATSELHRPLKLSCSLKNSFNTTMSLMKHLTWRTRLSFTCQHGGWQLTPSPLRVCTVVCPLWKTVRLYYWAHWNLENTGEILWLLLKYSSSVFMCSNSAVFVSEGEAVSVCDFLCLVRWSLLGPSNWSRAVFIPLTWTTSGVKWKMKMKGWWSFCPSPRCHQQLHCSALQLCRAGLSSPAQKQVLQLNSVCLGAERQSPAVVQQSRRFNSVGFMRPVNSARWTNKSAWLQPPVV